MHAPVTTARLARSTRPKLARLSVLPPRGDGVSTWARASVPEGRSAGILPRPTPLEVVSWGSPLLATGRTSEESPRPATPVRGPGPRGDRDGACELPSPYGLKCSVPFSTGPSPSPTTPLRQSASAQGCGSVLGLRFAAAASHNSVVISAPLSVRVALLRFLAFVCRPVHVLRSELRFQLGQFLQRSTRTGLAAASQPSLQPAWSVRFLTSASHRVLVVLAWSLSGPVPWVGRTTSLALRLEAFRGHSLAV